MFSTIAQIIISASITGPKSLVSSLTIRHSSSEGIAPARMNPPTDASAITGSVKCETVAGESICKASQYGLSAHPVIKKSSDATAPSTKFNNHEQHSLHSQFVRGDGLADWPSLGNEPQEWCQCNHVFPVHPFGSSSIDGMSDLCFACSGQTAHRISCGMLHPYFATQGQDRWSVKRRIADLYWLHQHERSYTTSTSILCDSGFSVSRSQSDASARQARLDINRSC